MVSPAPEGYLGSLTPIHEMVFIEYKKQLAEKASEWKFDLSIFDDYDHLRFLRARKFDLKKTMEMFDKYIKWRVENRVDQIFFFKFPEIESIKEIYPHGLHKTDKLGRAIYIERIGMLDVDELFRRTTKERIIQYYIREYEKFRLVVHPSCSNVCGKKMEQGCTIIDLLHGGSSLLAPKTYGFVKIATAICQDYFPEMLGIMFIVNTSWLLRTGWYIIKPFMDAKTVDKIHILGGSFTKELSQYIDIDSLPSFLGGKCECKPNGCLNEMPGPWKSYLDKFPKDTDKGSSSIPPLPEKWKPIVGTAAIPGKKQKV